MKLLLREHVSITFNSVEIYHNMLYPIMTITMSSSLEVSKSGKEDFLSWVSKIIDY